MNEALGNIVYRLARVRREPTFVYLAKDLRTQHAPVGELRGQLRQRLATLHDYVRAHVLFYQELSTTTFEELPLVAKVDIQERSVLFTSAIATGNRTKKVTCGSTSEPLSVLKDCEAMAREQAATYLGYSWAGVRPGARQARFWGVPLTGGAAIRRMRLKDALLNRVRYSAFNYTAETLDGFCPRLRKQDPTFVYGYVSAICEFARFLRDHPERRPFRCLKAVITTAEVLDASARDLIETEFGVRVFGEYGCAEVGSIAHECESRRMHVAISNVHVEVLDDDGIIWPEGEGRFVLTELHNRLQPLVRYDSGDYGVLSWEPCTFGRASPVLADIHGRARDIIVGPEGRRYNAAFFSYIFKEVQLHGEQIRQIQVVRRIGRLPSTS